MKRRQYARLSGRWHTDHFWKDSRLAAAVGLWRNGYGTDDAARLAGVPVIVGTNQSSVCLALKKKTDKIA